MTEAICPVAPVLGRVREAGGRLVLSGEKLKIRAPAALPKEIRAEVRRLKPALVAVLRDGARRGDRDCGCLCCRPNLWRNGEVLRMLPLSVPRDFLLDVKVLMNAGLERKVAERRAYREVRKALARKGE